MLTRVKEFFKDLPIKEKMMWIILSIVAVVMLITVSAFSFNGVANIKKQLRDEMAITATIISNRANTAIFYQNNTAVKEIISALNANQSIKIACVYDKNDNVFANHVNGFPSTSSCPTVSNQIEGVIFTNDALKLKRDIIDPFDRSKVASLYIESDLQKVSSYITKQIYISLGIIFAAAMVAYILASRLQKVISNPIQGLIDKNSSLEYFHPSQDYLQSTDEMKKLQIMVTGILEQAKKYQEKAIIATTELNNAVKNAECTFTYLLNELKQPVQSTMAYADILNSATLSQDEQISYYNDVYFTVFFYYGIINDTMEFYKKHITKKYNKHEKIHPSKMLKEAMNNAIEAKPDFIENLKIYVEYDIDQDLPKLVVDKVITQELFHNILFVYSKYLEFLDIYNMTIKISAGKDFSDPDSERFKITVNCKELQIESVDYILENHRSYQNDVHLLRSKLQYLKYLASYNGSHLDFGDDLRNVATIAIMFPWSQVNPSEDGLYHNDNILEFDNDFQQITDKLKKGGDK